MVVKDSVEEALQTFCMFVFFFFFLYLHISEVCGYVDDDM